MRAAERRAERLGGRLDPPMVVPLDEAANICRIADLPELYSHLGSRGMVPVTILQSYQQGVAVWGEPGMAALWGASTKKVIGAGIDDPRHARALPRGAHRFLEREPRIHAEFATLPPTQLRPAALLPWRGERGLGRHETRRHDGSHQGSQAGPDQEARP